MTADQDTTAIRIEGAVLALNTLEHFLSNYLARTVLCCELMRDDPRLPEDLRGQAQRAMDGATQAVETIRQLRRLTPFGEHGQIGLQIIEFG